jgi:hypothetical protein
MDRYSAYSRATSFARLKEVVCAACGEEFSPFLNNRIAYRTADFTDAHRDALKARGVGEPERCGERYGDPMLTDLCLEWRGLDTFAGTMNLCPLCSTACAAGRIPRRAYANALWCEAQPAVLACLTPTEVLLIGLLHTHCLIYRIHPGASDDARHLATRKNDAGQWLRWSSTC